MVREDYLILNLYEIFHDLLVFNYVYNATITRRINS